MNKQRTIWWVTGLALSLVLIYILSPVLTPFVAAAIIAYLFDPLVNRMQAWKLPRTLAVALVFLLMIALLALFLGVLIPLLQQQITDVISKVPDMINWVQATAVPWTNQKFDMNIQFDINSVKKALPQDLQQASSLFNTVWHTVFSSGKAIIIWFTNLFLIPVVIFYLLRDWGKVVNGMHELLPRRNESTISNLLKECDEVLGAFLRGQLMVMIALGFLYSLGLSLVGLKLALLIGLIAGLLSIVPYLGFIVGIGAALTAAIFQFHDIWHCIAVLIVFIIAQTIEGMALTPILVGDRIGMHPVAVIFAVLAGGQLFGFFGILLALPVAAVIMVFVRHLKTRYLNSNLYRT
jgi:predicted PurR-regulated permease PerM